MRFKASSESIFRLLFVLPFLWGFVRLWQRPHILGNWMPWVHLNSWRSSLFLYTCLCCLKMLHLCLFPFWSTKCHCQSVILHTNRQWICLQFVFVRFIIYSGTKVCIESEHLITFTKRNSKGNAPTAVFVSCSLKMHHFILSRIML